MPWAIWPIRIGQWRGPRRQGRGHGSTRYGPCRLGRQCRTDRGRPFCASAPRRSRRRHEFSQPFVQHRHHAWRPAPAQPPIKGRGTCNACDPALMISEIRLFRQHDDGSPSTKRGPEVRPPSPEGNWRKPQGRPTRPISENARAGVGAVDRYRRRPTDRRALDPRAGLELAEADKPSPSGAARAGCRAGTPPVAARVAIAR